MRSFKSPWPLIASLALTAPSVPAGSLVSPYPEVLRASCGNCASCTLPGIPVAHRFDPGGYYNGFAYHGCWIGPCNEFGYPCVGGSAARPEDRPREMALFDAVRGAVRRLESGDWRPLAALIDSTGGRVQLNAVRSAVQVTGCNKDVVAMHLPISEWAVESIRNAAETD